MNDVKLSGRLTRDPELKHTPNGVPVATFSLAVDRKFNREEADFVPIVAWRPNTWRTAASRNWTAKTVIFRSEHRQEGGDDMDAKEKARRAKERTTRRVYDILKNHDQETRTIEAQIEAERAALEADLAEIRTRAYPRAVRYDTPRVQSSPDPDGNMVKIAAAIERRTARTKRAVEALEDRQRQIENVHEIVLAMDAKAKIVLLTMYYPRRTYEQAAEALGMDVSTVSRQRKTAVERLVRKYIRLHGAIE